VVASLEAEDYGEEPSAQSLLDVVASMDNELEVNVVLKEALPPPLRAKLEAKKAELDERKKSQAVVCDTWAFQPRGAFDAPERLARLISASAAASCAAECAARGPAGASPVADEGEGAETETETLPRRLRKGLAESLSRLRGASGGQEAGADNAPAGGARSPSRPESLPGSPLALGGPAVPDPDGGEEPQWAPPSPGQTLLLPGEMPGGPSLFGGQPEAAVMALPAPQGWRAKGGGRVKPLGRHTGMGDRRTSLAAALAAFEIDGQGQGEPRMLGR
jgi:hypothetical protein